MLQAQDGAAAPTGTILAETEYELAFFAVAHSNRDIIISGGSKDGADTNEVMKFSLDDHSLEAMTPMQEKRHYHSMEIVNQTVFVFGG